MQTPKLIVTDFGDPSVGIFPVSWEIEVPLCVEDLDNLDEYEKDNLEFFREKIKELYKDFCDGRCIAIYEHEFKFEEDSR